MSPSSKIVAGPASPEKGTLIMESFLQSIAQNVNSFIGLWLMKQINTGDRMMDTTVQVIFTTITGAIITGLVTLYTKGLWKEWCNLIQTSLGQKGYDGLEFNPSFAPEKPANQSNYVFRSKRFDSHVFWAWFNLYHANKRYTQKLTESIVIADLRHEDELLLTGAGVGGERIPSVDIAVPMPIWKGDDGFYVYVKGQMDDDVTFYSDSGKALSDCTQHLRAFKERASQYAKEKDRNRNISHIREFNTKETRDLGQVEANRSLDTMFFSQKESIVRMLTAFKEKTLFPKHLPIDNKLGILLHGPPGTGKTGFIAAMANFLGRNIMLIHTSQIKRRKHLDDIFEYDNSRYIFVFEEFDCMPGIQRRLEADEKGGTGGTVTNSNNSNSDKSDDMKQMDPTAYAIMLMAQKEKSDDIMAEYREDRAAEKDKVDLHYLLTKIDGLQSANDRIIVATTNYPDRIDPALLRPGRFGVQLNLTNCTRKMIIDLLTMIFQLEGEQKLDLAMSVAPIEELKWSPAEILQLGISKGSYKDVVEHMLTKEPSQF